MIKVIVTCSLLFAFLACSAQETEKVKGAGGMSFGWKNPYGAVGIYYNRRIPVKNHLLEIRSGFGIKQSGVLGIGLANRVYSNDKKIEILISTDYSYHFPGIISFDDDVTFDKYKFSAVQYFSPYLIFRLFSKYDNHAFQFKLGYSHLLYKVNAVPTSGPNEQYPRAQRTLDGGTLIGIDVYLYIKSEHY